MKTGNSASKVICIKNMSAINTKAKLCIKKFKALELDEKVRKCSDPLKRPTKLANNFKLSDCTQGIGFGLELSSIDLPAFGFVNLKVIAIAQMWGSYEDALLISVDGICYDLIMPIYINVIDIPIKLYASKVQIEAEDEEISMIR
jgi:hypothetical protein